MVKQQTIQDKFLLAKTGSKRDEEALFSYLRVRFSVIAKKRIKKECSEDIAHDACLIVLEKYKNLPNDTVFESWAYQVLRNKIGNYLRDSKVREVVQTVDKIDLVGANQASSDKEELKIILYNCLKKMKQHNSNYIRILKFVVQGYSTREICDNLSITPNNLYVLLYRCRKLLYDCVYKTGKI